MQGKLLLMTSSTYSAFAYKSHQILTFKKPSGHLGSDNVVEQNAFCDMRGICAFGVDLSSPREMYARLKVSFDHSVRP